MEETNNATSVDDDAAAAAANLEALTLAVVQQKERNALLDLEIHALQAQCAALERDIQNRPSRKTRVAYSQIIRRDRNAKKLHTPWTLVETTNIKRLLKIYNYQDFDEVNVDMEAAAKLYALCQKLQLHHRTTNEVRSRFVSVHSKGRNCATNSWLVLTVFCDVAARTVVQCAQGPKLHYSLDGVWGNNRLYTERMRATCNRQGATKGGCTHCEGSLTQALGLDGNARSQLRLWSLHN
jgi:hypothetical protein